MPAGDAFSGSQLEAINRAIEQAAQESSLTYSVYVGAPDEDLRTFGLRLLAASAADSVIVLVDPADRRLEIVTGPSAALALDDRATALGAMSMTSSFAVGDLAGGIVAGLHTLAEHARQPRMLHTDGS